MLLIVEKAIRVGKYYAVYRYVKANNKYMKDYNKTKESSYFKYWNVNSLYGWAMSQRLPVNGLEGVKETSKFNEGFIENYNEKGDEGYFLEIDVQHPEKLHELHHDLPVLPERMKIHEVEELVPNLHDKKISYLHNKFKATIKSWISFEKVHRVIKFNQKA